MAESISPPQSKAVGLFVMSPIVNKSPTWTVTYILTLFNICNNLLLLNIVFEEKFLH